MALFKTLSKSNIRAPTATNHRPKTPVQQHMLSHSPLNIRPNTPPTRNLVAPWEDSTPRIPSSRGPANGIRSRPLNVKQGPPSPSTQSPPSQRPVDGKRVTPLNQNPPDKPCPSRPPLPTPAVERTRKQLPPVPSKSDDIILLKSSVVSIPDSLLPKHPTFSPNPSSTFQ